MTRRYLAFRYGWSATVYLLMRSSRWSEDEKAVHMTMLGMLVSGPFVASQVLWLLTGRGPIRWLYRPTSAAWVDPFPRWTAPADGWWERYIAEGRAKYGDPPVFVEPASRA